MYLKFDLVSVLLCLFNLVPGKSLGVGGLKTLSTVGSDGYVNFDQQNPGRPEYPAHLNTTHCGDLLIANRGFINYKLNQAYNNNERCIWTLRTPKWQTSFMVLEEGFHSENDRLDMYVVNENGLLERQAQITKETGSKIVGVIGPTVFLVFTTDQTGTGNGFLLEYFAFGYYELSGYHYDHSHFSSASGSLSWPVKPVEHPMNIFSTFTIQPSTSKNPLVLSVNKVDLISLVNGCHHNYFSVHQLFQDGFQVRLRYCQADLLTFATISASSPIVITYTATMGPQQTGIAFSWR